MANFKKNKKAQSLPLNTIVIALLVIIVLLVIIYFFTSNFGESTSTVNTNSPNKCSSSNPALSTLGYKDFEPTLQTSSCDTDYGWEEIKIIPHWEDNGQKYMCCGRKS